MIRSLYKILALPLFADNYSYILAGTYQNSLVLVDPANPDVVHQFLTRCLKEYYVSHILYTHKHWDHAGGSKRLIQLLQDKKVEVCIGKNDASHVEGITKQLDEQKIKVGQSQVNIYTVPCHTRGHIIYHFLPPKQQNSANLFANLKEQNLFTHQKKKIRVFQAEQCAFSGDTLFSGGVGKFFEGNAEQMAANLQKISKNLPDNCKIFNGHQYTLSNLKWSCQIQPDNEFLVNYTKQIAEMECTLPTTIEKQKKINVFLRAITGTPLHQKVCNNKVQLLRILREMKNAGAISFTKNET